jgi:hypothetical protein
MADDGRNYSMQDTRCRIQDARCKMQDTGCKMQGYSIQDARARETLNDWDVNG